MRKKQSLNLTKTKLARLDLAEIAAYYGEESLELELRFLDAAEKAFTQITNMPAIGAKREYFPPQLQTVRMWPIPDFPQILIFYRVVPGSIEVIRVLHTARDMTSLVSR